MKLADPRFSSFHQMTKQSETILILQFENRIMLCLQTQFIIVSVSFITENTLKKSVFIPLDLFVMSSFDESLIVKSKKKN